MAVANTRPCELSIEVMMGSKTERRKERDFGCLWKRIWMVVVVVSSTIFEFNNNVKSFYQKSFNLGPLACYEC